MGEKDSLNRIWDIIEKANPCMLTTQFTGGLRARPLEARADRHAGLLFFVTDYPSDKEEEIQAKPDVGIVIMDSKDSTYLSITGRACISRDIEKIKAVWRESDDVWWRGGPEDPKVCLLQIQPIIGELWDEPRSRIVTYLEFAKAKLTGQEPNLGENRKVTVKM